MGHRRTGTDLSIYMAVTSKMHQVTAFPAVVNIGNIRREYFSSPRSFSILPFLTYGHLSGVDLIPDASGVAFPSGYHSGSLFFLQQPLSKSMMSPSGRILTGVLPVAPFQSLIVCTEKYRSVISFGQHSGSPRIQLIFPVSKSRLTTASSFLPDRLRLFVFSSYHTALLWNQSYPF